MIAKASQNPSMLKILLPRLLTRKLQFALDLLVFAITFVFSYLLRFDFAMPQAWLHPMLFQLPYVVIIQFVTLNLAGGHTFIWRYFGIAHVRSFIYAIGGCGVGLILLRFCLPEWVALWRVPLSIIIIDATFAFGGVVGLRIARRVFCEEVEKRQRSKSSDSKEHFKRPVLLIGAGMAGVMAAREIVQRGNLDLDIKGFVDDDPGKQIKTVVYKLKVLGTIDHLPELVRKFGIDHVIITIAQSSRQQMRRILDICERIQVRVRIIPGLYEILQGHVEVSRIRDVRIEDLLGREPVQLDEESLNLFLAGKTVMVTGAGGSIGSELARQVVKFQPARILLVERAENALFNVERELREANDGQRIEPLVADICDDVRMRDIFKKYRPHVVLHAAAHKHVPLMEVNPAEAVKNNVLGTRLLGEMAGEFNAEVFVLISTDKAVCPTSIMGATKRLAELFIQDLNRRATTRYVAVRFGNVIGSAGSVIPIFREQIRKGGPVTITDKRMKRYFMTIPEAAQLVLQAGAVGNLGNGGEVFILHMGEPVSILELAESLITLSGFKPYEDIKIIETGIRPGEKLYEELLTTEESVAETQHPKIFINKLASRTAEDIRLAFERLELLSRNGHEQELRLYINQLLPEATLDSLPRSSENARNPGLGDEATSTSFEEKPSDLLASAQASYRTSQP
jgi:FlaA1/EpsC-like NDP-sugar epimerase